MSDLRTRQGLTAETLRVTGGTVAHGPFKGLRLMQHNAWGDDIASKLLGCYEHVLHPVIDEMIGESDRAAAVVNVGCADGYYALGMAMRLGKGTRVYGVDVSPTAGASLASNAELNGLGDAVAFSTDSSCAAISRLLSDCRDRRVLLVSDCEGHEIDMLDPAAVPELRDAEMLVECHDQFNAAITPTLLQRFEATHDVQVVYETGVSAPPARLPEELAGYDEQQVHLLLDEHRGCVMHWMHLVPKPKPKPKPPAGQLKLITATSDNYAPVFERFRDSLVVDGRVAVDLLVHRVDTAQHGTRHAFQSDSWYAAVREKMSHLSAVLAAATTADGEYVVFSDADVEYYAPQRLAELVREASERGLEYYGMREGHTQEYNTGFMVLRNTAGVRALVDEVVARLASGERPTYGDQSIINERIGASGVAHAHIDAKRYVWGDGIPTHDTIFHHAVCCHNVAEKLAQMDRVRARFAGK